MSDGSEMLGDVLERLRWQESLGEVGRQLEQLSGVSRQQAEATGENTEAVAQNTQAQVSHSGSLAGDIGRTASRLLGGGLSLGLSPLISGIASLFRGEPAEPPPLTPYVRPEALRFDGAAPQAGSQTIYAADYGQDGLPRVNRAATVYSPQITVQVQAMDSRSFLDHSDDIARAVRQAMLNGHGVNDVVGEL